DFPFVAEHALSPAELLAHRGSVRIVSAIFFHVASTPFSFFSSLRLTASFLRFKVDSKGTSQVGCRCGARSVKVVIVAIESEVQLFVLILAAKRLRSRMMYVTLQGSKVVTFPPPLKFKQ